MSTRTLPPKTVKTKPVPKPIKDVELLGDDEPPKIQTTDKPEKDQRKETPENGKQDAQS